MEKACLSCQITKPVSDFYTDRSRPDALSVYCKPCTKAKVKEYRTHAPKHPAPEGMKRCEICKETKAETEFYAAKNNAGGLSKRCKECAKRIVQDWRAKNPERHREGSKQWAAKHREQVKDANLARNYGLAPGAYKEMLSAQGGTCAICHVPPEHTRLHVDHCHDTGIVRGLLCTNCNTGLGQFKHREALLQEAIKYLQVLPEGGVER